MDKTIRTDRVDVLDGIRAGAILIVAFFHFWQQSWFSVQYSSPFLTRIGIENISTDAIHRYGFVFVDMMIMMTGFCLFLPYARHMIEGARRPGLPDPKELWSFYKKRLVRIVPSYLFCFLIFLFFIVLPARDHATLGDLFKDKHLMQNIIAQLTFTQNLSKSTYLGTLFNGALWTVAVEMQFYLIFPLIAWAFRKKPLITYACMMLTEYAFIQFAVLPKADGDLGMWINQLPALIGVFANGMMGALLFVALANRLKTREKYTSILATVICFASVFGIMQILNAGASKYSHIQRWQVIIRFPMAMLFTIFTIAACFSAAWFRFIFSNRIARFLAAISYNFYIWHQTIAVKLKEWHIPPWTGKELPNVSGDRKWQIMYTVIIVVASVTFATCVTYGLEKPIAKLFLRGKKKKETEAAVKE